MKCVICNKEASKDSYCELHLKAYENVIKKYDIWKRASGVFWREYLNEIVKNPLTGEWAKEVAEHLLKSGEKGNVKES